MHEAHVARLKAKGKGGGGEEGGEGSEQSKLKVSFPLLRGLHARRVDALAESGRPEASLGLCDRNVLARGTWPASWF
jgi:hypothetical protein